MTAPSRSSELRFSRHFKVEPVAKGVYAAVDSERLDGGGAAANAGIVDLGDETLIFDAFMTPGAAAELRAAVRELTGHPVRYVVNSHFHYDHVRGNQVFAEEAAIIGTEWTRDAMQRLEPELIEQEREESPVRVRELESRLTEKIDDLERRELEMMIGFYRAQIESHAGLEPTPPTMTFETKLVIHGAERSAELLHWGGGHTASDVVLYLPGDRVLFAGDLLSIGVVPFLGHGSPDGWTEYLQRLELLSFDGVVPGHGRVGAKEDIRLLLHYIAAVQERVGEAIREGETIDDLAGEEPPPPFDAWLLGDFHGLNLQSVFAMVTEDRI